MFSTRPLLFTATHRHHSTTTTALSRIVLMIRSDYSDDESRTALARAVRFYHEILRLPLLRQTTDAAELRANPYTILHLRTVLSEPQLSTGYSPVLTFQINPITKQNNNDNDNDNSHFSSTFEETIAACVQAGGHLDGPVQFPAHGKVATLRTPDGHMIGLYEPSVATAISTRRRTNKPTGPKST